MTDLTPAPAPSLKRAFATYGASFGMMMVVSLIFYVIKTPKGGINIPWLSVAISLGAVLLPAAVASYWPKQGAPGRLPSFKPQNAWLMAGAAFFSLPLYIIFAACQIALGHLFTMHADTSLVQPLTANDVGSFMWIWLSIAVLPALTEETLYRGVMQSAMVNRWGPLWGISAAAFFFSLAHMEPAGFVSRILMGLWFGYLYWRTGSLLPGAIAHALNNSWGVALANWHVALQAHMPWVYAVGVLCAAAGYACMHQARFWPWQATEAALPEAGASTSPELPRFVTMARPQPPHGEKK